MSLPYVILGFLGWRPLTGYDLKKLVAESDFLPWSGNSNQIYTALVRHHREGRVAVETVQQESLPPRKIYSLTEAGREALDAWVRAAPELPDLRSTFLAQLAWADGLEAEALDDLVGRYEEEVELQLLMVRERAERGGDRPDRTPRERYLWKMAQENRIRAWETELGWARELRSGLRRRNRRGGAR